MKRVNFNPWVGRNYKKQVNPRLLILGEAHYDRDGDITPQSTIDLTREYVNGWKHPFWTNIMQVVAGRGHDEIDKDAFWSKVALYNYIQEIVAKTTRVGPTNEMMKNAEQPFLEVLAALKPTHVLVMCKRLWDNMGGGHEDKPIRWNKDKSHETWEFPYKGGIAKATWLKHPSSGFSWTTWHPLVMKFLGKAI